MLKIILKNRTADATAPTTSDIEKGEVAVNAFSGVVYINYNDGSPSGEVRAIDMTGPPGPPGPTGPTGPTNPICYPPKIYLGGVYA